jgi:protein-tyrosine phosphatase
MSYAIMLGALGCGLIGLGAQRGWPGGVIVWLGADFLALSVAHAVGGHGLSGKRADGTIPGWSRVVFLPLMLVLETVWRIWRFGSREPAISRVNDWLAVGSRPRGGEGYEAFDVVVDLTAEFEDPSAIRRRTGYRPFPILDGSSPDEEALRRFLRSLAGERLFVHCAQGHGRTGLVAAALLIERGTARTPEEAIHILRQARPKIAVNAVQRKCLDAYHASRGSSNGL